LPVLKIIQMVLILKTPPKGEYSSDLYSLEKLSPYANPSTNHVAPLPITVRVFSQRSKSYLAMVVIAIVYNTS